MPILLPASGKPRRTATASGSSPSGLPYSNVRVVMLPCGCQTQGKGPDQTMSDSFVTSVKIAPAPDAPDAGWVDPTQTEAEVDDPRYATIRIPSTPEGINVADAPLL